MAEYDRRRKLQSHISKIESTVQKAVEKAFAKL